MSHWFVDVWYCKSNSYYGNISTITMFYLCGYPVYYPCSMFISVSIILFLKHKYSRNPYLIHFEYLMVTGNRVYDLANLIYIFYLTHNL